MSSPELIGTPVRGVNWVRAFGGLDARGTPCYYCVMGQNADNLFVLQIDPQRGVVRQAISPVPDSDFPTAAVWSRRYARLFIGAAHAGRLLQYDPNAGRIEDLGKIAAERSIFPCRIEEAPDGRLWIGVYNPDGATLTCYDPEEKTFTQLPNPDDVDMYCYPLVAPGGVVVIEVKMTRPHLVWLDPDEGVPHKLTQPGEPGQRWPPGASSGA